MVATLHKDENFSKRAIKKQQSEKLVCWLNTINRLLPKNDNESKILINWLWLLECIIWLIDSSQKVGSKNPILNPTAERVGVAVRLA